MKTTNAIDKALKQKAYIEIEELVGRFIKDIETNIKDKYNTQGYYYQLKDSSSSDAREFTIKHSHLDSVLIRMLVEEHQERMVDCKSAELINKLNLDI